MLQYFQKKNALPPSGKTGGTDRGAGSYQVYSEVPKKRQWVKRPCRVTSTRPRLRRKRHTPVHVHFVKPEEAKVGTYRGKRTVSSRGSRIVLSDATYISVCTRSPLVVMAWLYWPLPDKGPALKTGKAHIREVEGWEDCQPGEHGSRSAGKPVFLTFFFFFTTTNYLIRSRKIQTDPSP